MAHLSICIWGSIYFAIDSSTTMFVMRVANSPSSFMLLSRITLSIPISSSIPSISKILLLSSTLKRDFSYSLYYLNFPSRIFFPSKLERLYIIFAHFQLFPSMIDLMKFTKLRRSCSSNLMTIPTSIRVILTLSVHCLTIFIICYSSSRLDLYNFFKVQL